MFSLKRTGLIGAVIAAALGGTFTAAPASASGGHYYVLIGGTCDGKAANYPAGSFGGGTPIRVHYPATAPPACNQAPLTVPNYDASVAQGHAAAVDEVTKAYKADPEGEFTIVGYSQGAQVANLVLNDIADNKIDIPHNQVTAKIYADPMQPKTGIDAVVPKGVGIPAPMAMTSAGPGRTDFDGIRYTRYCIKTDGVCDATTVEAPGGYFAQHQCYTPKMRQTIADGSYRNGVEWMEKVDCHSPIPGNG